MEESGNVLDGAENDLVSDEPEALVPREIGLMKEQLRMRQEVERRRKNKKA